MPVPSLLQLIRELVASPSVSSVNPTWDQGNQPVVDLLAGWLQDLGFQIQILPVPGHAGKSNLVASAGSGPDGLVLSGHTDTVPYDQGRWTYDPFVVTESAGRLYGLGTCDMKAFFALAIEALRDLRLADLRRPLTLVATADEESGMCGAQALVQTHLRLGRHALIGEPTGLRPVRLHKGIMMEAIRLRGSSGHSSNPALGNSALEGMHEIITEILRWRDDLQQEHRNPLFEVAVPTLNLGHIHGGDNPNRICAECDLHIDLRTLPGMVLGELRSTLDSRLRPLSERRGLAFEMVSLFPGVEALETPATAAIVQSAETLTGQTAQAVAFATEGPYFNQIGMQTLILGPGDIEQAHRPDEYIRLDRLRPTVDLLQSLIKRFCL